MQPYLAFNEIHVVSDLHLGGYDDRKIFGMKDALVQGHRSDRGDRSSCHRAGRDTGQGRRGCGARLKIAAISSRDS
jgi:hypothetical protein